MPADMSLTERLRNPQWDQPDAPRALETDRAVATMAAAADVIDTLMASVQELLSVYWGDGDGREPPACIARAQQALDATSR